MQKLLTVSCIIILSACRQKKSVDAYGAMLAGAANHPGEWLTHGLNYNEDRCSQLTQITKENVGTLELAWVTDLQSKRGFAATPLIADGVMYVTGVWSIVYAPDASAGKILWPYDPKVPPETAKKLCRDIVNRSVAFDKGKIYSGTLDERLLALDAATGKMQWEVMSVDNTKPYSIKGAPRIIDGKVIICNGGAEFGVRDYVTAYDAETGSPVRRFYTLPGAPSKPSENKAMEAAAKAWSGDWWQYGGGTVWNAMAYNPKLNLAYIPARENASNYVHNPEWTYNKRGFGTGNGWNLGTGNNSAVPTRTDTATKKFPRGTLIAWNPALRKEVWRVPQTADWNGGALATVTDLFFQGTAGGDFFAFDGSNGNILWTIRMGGGIIALPVSYTVGDKQYITVAACWGGGYGMKKKFVPVQTGRIYTFVLNGKGIMPAFNQSTRLTMPEASFTATISEAKHGEELSNRFCTT